MAPITLDTEAGARESYQEMGRDVEEVGRHCQMEYCHKLDFLPFKCLSCHGMFCLEHRTETAHKCPKEGAWAQRNRPQYVPSLVPAKPSDERPCADPGCEKMTSKTLTTGLHCSTCNRQYCITHRMPEDHNCKNLVPLGARPRNKLQQQGDKGISALARLKVVLAERKQKDQERRERNKDSPIFSIFRNKANSEAAEDRAKINEVKKTAKGDPKIPQDKRVYLFVEASADTTKAKYPTGKFYYNKDWSVGRVLDMAAKALQVENINNRGGGEEEKLRVFHVEGGRLLKFTEKIGDPCATGNKIILLRGVGSGEPDLIDL